jgi:hypothetical protein
MPTVPGRGDSLAIGKERDTEAACRGIYAITEGEGITEALCGAKPDSFSDSPLRTSNNQSWKSTRPLCEAAVKNSHARSPVLRTKRSGEFV